MLKDLSSNQRIAVSALLALILMVAIFVIAFIPNTPTPRPVATIFYWLLYFPRPVFDLFMPNSPDPFEPEPGMESAIASWLTTLLIYSFAIDAIIARYARKHVGATEQIVGPERG